MTTHAATVVAVPPSRTVIVAIALNTFREAIRDRVLYLLLVFAMLLIGASRMMSMITVGNEEKLVKDMGLAAISVIGVLTAVFVGVSLVFKEIERRTVYTLLANPVRRWQFVVGKFVGLLVVLGMNLLLMSSGLIAIVLFRGESPWMLLPAVLMIFVELSIVTAFALLFSSLTNPMLAAVWTFASYVTGHLSWSLLLLKERMPEGGLGRPLCQFIYWILPNLDRLDIKAEVVNGTALPVDFIPLSVLYGFSYAAVILLLACAVFERKDFN